MLEEYLDVIPYFLFFVFLGVFANFLFGSTKSKLGFKRIIREIVGAIWISLIIFAVLNEFFNLSELLIFVSCSIAGFGNSRIIDFLQKDFFEFLILQGKQAVKNIVGRLKKSDDMGGEYPHFPRYMEDETPEEVREMEVIDEINIDTDGNR